MSLTNALWLLAGAVVAACYCILTQRRHVPHLTFEVESLPHIHRGLQVIAGLTRAAVHLGNRAEVFQNGAFFDALERDIRNAEHTVHIETFVWTRGTLEARFADLLCAKARAGVEVRLVIDAMGGIRASRARLDQMRACGVNVQIFCKPHWWNLRRLNHRTHRKIFILDGRVGYTGGHGIADQWLGEAQDSAHWRDTAVRLEGPIVHAMQAVFLENFIWECERVPSGERSFPHLEVCGTIESHIASDSAGLAISSVAMLYSVAIACARQEVLIQNPYFAPDDSIVALFAAVIQRGVTVRLMVPGENTDSPFVRRAGCNLYEPLLRAGVRIYEYQPTLLHQKVVVVDDVWSHVGSTNFDSRSLKLNEEIGIGLLDCTTAAQLKEAFVADLLRSRELTLDQWLKRPLGSRAIDWLCYQVHDQL